MTHGNHRTPGLGVLRDRPVGASFLTRSATVGGFADHRTHDTRGDVQTRVRAEAKDVGHAYRVVDVDVAGPTQAFRTDCRIRAVGGQSRGVRFCRCYDAGPRPDRGSGGGPAEETRQ